MSAKAGRYDDQYMVRFPPGMRDRIKAAAEENGRSMNSEIISRLEDSFETAEIIPSLGKALDKLEARRDEDTRQIREVLDFYAMQTRLMRELLEGVAEDGPNLNPAFHTGLRDLLKSSRGKAESQTERPSPPPEEKPEE